MKVLGVLIIARRNPLDQEGPGLVRFLSFVDRLQFVVVYTDDLARAL